MEAKAQALGRLPWLALFLRRARRLRPVLPISGLLVLNLWTCILCQNPHRRRKPDVAQ